MAKLIFRSQNADFSAQETVPIINVEMVVKMFVKIVCNSVRYIYIYIENGLCIYN